MSDLSNTNKDLWFRLTIVPLVGIITPSLTNVLPDGVVLDTFFAKNPYIFKMIAVVVLFEINRLSLRYCRRKLKAFSSIVVRLIIQLFLLVVITSVLLVFFLNLWYGQILNVDNFGDNVVSNVYVGLSAAIIFTLYYEMSYYIAIWQRENLLNKQLEIENVKSQLLILKNQLSPHFMFNALSNLSALIDSDKEKASEFLTKFSEAYRYLLKHDDAIFPSLEV